MTSPTFWMFAATSGQPCRTNIFHSGVKPSVISHPGSAASHPNYLGRRIFQHV